jgi:hypothetical protein
MYGDIQSRAYLHLHMPSSSRDLAVLRYSPTLTSYPLHCFMNDASVYKLLQSIN